MHREEGFTLIEMIVVFLIMAILFTLSASALRTYWLKHSLDAGGGEVVSQLRRLQERTVSEDHPLTYGVRFRVGTSLWSVVKFDPKDPSTTADDTCIEETAGGVAFDVPIYIKAASFTDSTTTTTICRSKIAGVVGTDQFVFYFARGTATPGSVTLSQRSLNQDAVVTVTPITGRTEVGGS